MPFTHNPNHPDSEEDDYEEEAEYWRNYDSEEAAKEDGCFAKLGLVVILIAFTIGAIHHAQNLLT